MQELTKMLCSYLKVSIFEYERFTTSRKSKKIYLHQILSRKKRDITLHWQMVDADTVCAF